MPLKIGYASEGDIKLVKDRINQLGIKTTVKDGYIYTREVSPGDQSYILTDCYNLNIPCKIHEELQNDCEKCRSELLLEIKELLKKKG